MNALLACVPSVPKARRMTKLDTMTEEKLTWHLDNWAAWMKGALNDGDYSSRASVCGSTSSREFDAMVAEADTRCAVAVSAIVDELPRQQEAAIHHFHLAGAYRLRGDVLEHYALGREAVRVGLNRRGIL